jgi:DNA polymerase-1
MSSSSQHLFLIDGHALAYRAYFALTGASDGSRWMTKAGEPTAGVYGFTSVLLRLLEQETPAYLAVSFDTGPTFRDQIFPEYKATREKMPEDLVPQFDRIRQVVSALGIPILEAEGYEADDVLGTVSKLAVEMGAEVTILTGDRDLLQLAAPHITIRLAGQKLSEAADYGPAEVESKYGVRTDQFVDYKALIGDSSDNIPGVRGIGEKTAVKLLTQYENLGSIYRHLDEIEARYRGKLEAGRQDAFLSQELAQIILDVPLRFNLEDCRRDVGFNREQVAALFRELEFRSLLDRLPGKSDASLRHQLNMFAATPVPVSGPAQQAHTVDSQESLQALAGVLADARQIAFDVETTGTDPMRADLVGISLAVEPGSGFYIPVGHLPHVSGGPQLPLDQVLEVLRRPLTDPDIPKVGHNLKYDFIMLARLGLPASPLSFDTMIAEWLCDPASRNLGLKSLAWVRLGTEMTPIDTLIGTGRNQRTMAEVPIVEVAPYAVADAQICLRLMEGLRSEMQAKNQLALFHELEMPLVTVLAAMEIAGIRLDTAFLAELSSELAERLLEIEQQIRRQVGHDFNINSPQQLSAVLFDELGLQPPAGTRRTASGHYSTAAGVLDELRSAHPVVDLILEQRELSKLRSTYTEALPAQVNPDTGRVHTSYNQTGSVTGRLASSEPNLQNIPIRTELGRRMRQAFIAAPGQALLSVDYSQIELRIVAHMANDRAMIQAFLDDQDIHATTAAAVFGIDPAQVSPEMRRRAKAVNFGLIYGMSAYGLTRSTDLTLGEAQAFVDAYFDRFPGVRQYLDQTRALAAKRGYVETLLGRRRYFPQLERNATAVSPVAHARAEREAINAPIQGTAADIIKLAMLQLPGALAEAGLDGRMLLQVHDELVIECPESQLAATAEVTQRVMRQAYHLKVPLKTDAKAGPNWSALHSLDA